jgi:hypothetical protein
VYGTYTVLLNVNIFILVDFSSSLRLFCEQQRKWQYYNSALLPYTFCTLIPLGETLQKKGKLLKHDWGTEHCITTTI